MSGTQHDDFERLPSVQAMLGDEGLDQLPEEAPIGPIYRKVGTSKVPVAKSTGKLWQGRIAAGKSGRSKFAEQWDTAIDYYMLAQSEHRNPQHNTSGNKRKARRKTEEWSQTENAIFSAIKALLPGIYAKNPDAEFTAADSNDVETVHWCSTLEKLVNSLGVMKAEPGVNLKFKIKQAIVCSKIMNLAWIEVGYTRKDQSSEQALGEIQRLSKELEEAKDTKVIEEIEGKLMALEEQIPLMTPAGPYARYYSGKDIVVDPEAMEPDFADARWMAVEDYLPTTYLNAVYGEKQPNGQVKSIYEPTAVLMASATGSEIEGNLATNFKLFDTNEAAHYGYKDQYTYHAAQRTKCWRIYDKLTRRVMLFADNKWDWPIWVEDDDLELPNFFPFEPLIFNVSPIGPLAHSEVAHVMDQQDAINEINDAERRARFSLANKVFFNQEVTDRASVERVLAGVGPAAQGIKVPEGMKMEDAFYTPAPNILRAPQLFDVSRVKQSMDGILGVTPSMRAAEYKTNTTNKAIEEYNANTGSRLDEQIDAIEDFIGRIYGNVGFLCARFMTQEEVGSIIGIASAQHWRQVNDPVALRRMYTMRIVGGSTTKPTSQFKKQTAVQLGQVLGQFVNAAPGTVTKIMLKLLENAFDEVGIEEADWAALNAEVGAKLGIEAQAAQPKPPTGPQAGPPGGAPQQPPQGADSAIQNISQAIDSLPPEAKIALGNAMAKGVSITEALPQVMKLVQGASAQQPQ